MESKMESKMENKMESKKEESKKNKSEIFSLKDKYDTLDEKIPILRGYIHGLSWPLFLYTHPIISINYLVSFLYHRVKINEEITRFLDHFFIALRILSFPETIPHKFFDRYPLLSILIIYYIIFHKIKNKIKSNSFDYYNVIQKLMILFSLIVAMSTHNKRIAYSGLLYLIPGFIFYLKINNLPWHSELWDTHEDFHLSLFIIDLYVCFYSKPHHVLNF